MTAAPARFKPTADLDFLLNLEAFDASIEAACHAVILDFGRTVGRDDGTRSAQVLAWSAEFARVAGEVA